MVAATGSRTHGDSIIAAPSSSHRLSPRKGAKATGAMSDLAAQYRQVLQQADADLVAVLLIGDALRPRTADMQVRCRRPTAT